MPGNAIIENKKGAVRKVKILTAPLLCLLFHLVKAIFMGSIVIDILILPCFQQTEANPLQGFSGCRIVCLGGGGYPVCVIVFQKVIRVRFGSFQSESLPSVSRTDKIGKPCLP